MTSTPIHVDRFHHDGRGPELWRVHWAARGATIAALDYHNPEDVYGAADLKHVFFINPQVVMITPEEVVDYQHLASSLAQAGRPAMFDLGRSTWLLSFNQRHLARCRHFQRMFYDELFDVICEDVECRAGGFAAGAPTS